MLHHDRVRSAGVGPTIQLSSRLTRAGLRDTRIILVAPPVWCRAWIGARFMWQSVSLDRGPQHLRQTGCQPQAQDLTEWDDERRERLRSPAGGCENTSLSSISPQTASPSPARSATTPEPTSARCRYARTARTNQGREANSFAPLPSPYEKLSAKYITVAIRATR